MATGKDLAICLGDLACAAVAVQRRLDQQNLVEWADLRDRLPRAEGLSETILSEVLAPPRVCVRRLRVDLELSLREDREHAAAVGLQLLGAPIHTFLELRRRRSKTCRAHMTLEIESLPLPSDEKTEERQTFKSALN